MLYIYFYFFLLQSVWASPTPCGRQSTEGRRKLVARYYSKRRFLRKGKLLKNVQKNEETPTFSSDGKYLVFNFLLCFLFYFKLNSCCDLFFQMRMRMILPMMTYCG